MLWANRLLSFVFLTVIGQGIVSATRQHVLAGFEHLNPATRPSRASRLSSPASKAHHAFQPSSSSQVRYKPHDSNTNNNTSLFTPFADFSALSSSAFTVLSHPLFPNHSLRIKKSNVCGTDDGVKSYTGYIDVGARHLFFYFFESRRNPDKDDVIFWTNGGPGCSSALGVFMELGPCKVLDGKTPTYHHESWNTNANILFVDQPVGVGFSYADYGESVVSICSYAFAQNIPIDVGLFFK